MSAIMMEYPSDQKLSLQMGTDGKPVSIQKEGKVLPLEFITPVDSKDPHVQALGKWAVAEHNKHTVNKLEFVSVTGGYRAGAEGATYYYLNIVAMDKCVSKNYEAVIMEIMCPELTKTLLLFTEKKC